MKISLIPVVIAALTAPTYAQLTDAPPVDMKQVLQGLKQFKEQNDTSIKKRRDGAYQQIVGAASSNERAAALWTSAVMAVQFAGVDHESAAAKEWLKGDGEGLKTKEGANAARLHLIWLGLTIQYSAGAETKQLLQSVIDFTKQVEADELAAGRLAEQIEKAKGVKRTGPNKALSEETHAKKIHDSILRTPVSNSPVAQSMQIADLLGDAGKRKKRAEDAPPASWEPVPGNVNGIYTAIILPEFRASKDPRLMDYWDMMIRKNQESLYAGMPAFDERQKVQVERPMMMWSRAQDMLLIGLRNRAITEMFNIIKAYPQHPDVANWIAELEQAAAPAAAIPRTGTVAPPSAVPSATTNLPTATIVPGAR